MPTAGETVTSVVAGETSSKGGRKGKRKQRRDRWEDGFGRRDPRDRAGARADQRYPLGILASFPAWALRKELRRREGGSDSDMGVRYKGRRRFLFGRGPDSGMWPSKKWASRQATRLAPVQITDNEASMTADVTDATAVPSGRRLRVGFSPTSGMWPSKKWIARQRVGLAPVPTELMGVSAFSRLS